MVMTAFAEIWTETIEQFTFCKMGVSMIRKFSLAISLMIRLNLLKYSYIIRPEVQRFFSLFVARQEMFPAIILNLSTLLLPIFTKLCWQQNIHIHFYLAVKFRGHSKEIITKNNQLSESPRNLIICFKDEKTLSGKGWKHEGGDILKCTVYFHLSDKCVEKQDPYHIVSLLPYWFKRTLRPEHRECLS